MNKDKIYKPFLAFVFTTITIGVLTLLTYKTNLGLFLVASFGSSMVLLYGYPESPFAKPKNILFGHLVTSTIGVLFYNYIPLPIYIMIPIAVGLGVGLMIMLNVTHPPAGGNPIIVILGSVSFEFLFSPMLTGCLIIIVFGILLNKFVAKKKYPWSNTIRLIDVLVLCYTFYTKDR